MIADALKAFAIASCTGQVLMALAQSSAATPSSSGSPSASSSGSLLPVSSPTWLPTFPVPSGVATSYPSGPIPTSATLDRTTLNLSSYPTVWESPPTDHPEVQAVIAAIDWSHVPNATVHKALSNGDLDMNGYDASNDPYCWWTDTNCVKPKVDYLPEDIYLCPRVGDWGLTYDDGPFNPTGDNTTDKYAEPELYNFLAAHNQKATLFYIGSNVITYPAAAQRAINDGHVICSHTWSHPQMTSQTNEQVVAELYWSLRAIKEATGVTTRCWRPPYGDVDDRVRAIAWQMGMRTIVWDEDTNDWNMPPDGSLSPDTVDGYFENWINARKNGSDNETGHIVLEHELNNSTVSMTEKWLPTLQETFNVVTVQECMNISQPYWETSWVYPTEANPNVSNASSSSTAASATVASSSSGSSASVSASTQSQQDSSDSNFMLPATLLVAGASGVLTAILAL